MTPVLGGSIGPADAPAPGSDALTADLGLMVDYLGGKLTLEQRAGVEYRLEHDDSFFENVAPLTIAWHTPQPFLEKGGLEMIGTPLPESEQKAQWERLESPQGISVPSHSKWGRRTVILMTAVASVVSGALAMKIREAWPVALADYYGGRALAPGASFWRPTMYQTAYGQEQTVALPTADVHLNSMSRLSIGWKSMGAIDGEAEIVVHLGKLLQLWVGDDPFTFGEGVYLLAHPLGPTTRLTVVKGAVKHGDDIYRTGAVITAESRGTKTTFLAREGGRERPVVTVTNHALRP